MIEPMNGYIIVYNKFKVAPHRTYYQPIHIPSMETTNTIKMSSLDSAKLRLLSIINLIALFSAFVSLKYFTTDGFAGLQ